jgi:hypothetical protein
VRKTSGRGDGVEASIVDGKSEFRFRRPPFGCSSNFFCSNAQRGFDLQFLQMFCHLEKMMNVRAVKPYGLVYCCCQCSAALFCGRGPEIKF